MPQQRFASDEVRFLDGLKLVFLDRSCPEILSFAAEPDQISPDYLAIQGSLQNSHEQRAIDYCASGENPMTVERIVAAAKSLIVRGYGYEEQPGVLAFGKDNTPHYDEYRHSCS